MRQEFFDVHHISFDVWLTLIRSNPVFKKERDLLFKNFFSLSQPIDQISDYLKRWDIRFTSINEVTGKNLDAEEMIAIVLSGLDHNLEKIGPALLSEYFIQQEALFTNYHPLLIENQLANYLQDLADREINLSILSNTGFIKGKLLRTLLDHLKIGSYFGFQLYSDEICCSKPSVEAFNTVFDRANTWRQIGKRNILHIGDNKNADVLGADNAGMQSALINSNNLSLLNLRIFK